MKMLNQLGVWNSVLNNFPSHSESWPPCSAQGETASQGASLASVTRDRLCCGVSTVNWTSSAQRRDSIHADPLPKLLRSSEWRALSSSAGEQGVWPLFLPVAALSPCPCDQTVTLGWVPPCSWARCQPEGAALWPPCQLGNRSILLLRKSTRPSNRLTFKKHIVRRHVCPIQISHTHTHTHTHWGHRVKVMLKFGTFCFVLLFPHYFTSAWEN